MVITDLYTNRPVRTTSPKKQKEPPTESAGANSIGGIFSVILYDE